MSQPPRPKTRFRLAIVLLSATLAGRAGLAQDYEPKPLPAGPDAPTHAQHVAAEGRFWRDLLLAECKLDEVTRAKCLPQVEEFFGAYAALLLAWQRDEAMARRIAELCDILSRLGNEDPVLQFVIGRVRLWQRRIDDAQTHFAAATKGFEGRQLPLRLQSLVQSGLADLHETAGDEEASAAAHRRLDDVLVELVASAEFGDGQERYLLDHLDHLWGGDVSADDLGLLQRMGERAGKPCYALLVLRSRYHVRMAWAARGQGVASTIGDSDLQSFSAHLQASAEAAQRAHELCPRHPEAPTMMIRTLGPGGAEPEELRAWFDRAVAGEFDHLEAYSNLLHYLQPRWGGSQRALLEFGEECLDTGRFDTSVPDCYRSAIHYLCLDSRQPLTVWARTSVQERLAELGKGSLAAADTPRAERVAKTHEVMRLALGGDAAAAAKLAEQMGGSVEERVLEIYDVKIDWLRKTLRPHLANYAPKTIEPSAALAGYEAAGPGDGAHALGSNERAPTVVQIDRGFADWIGKTMVKGYETAGVHDAAWDETVRAMLAEFGNGVAFGHSKENAARAEKLLEVGCKDPLSLYVVTRVLDGTNPSRLVRTLAGAMPGLESAQTPVMQWWAKQHLGTLARRLGRPDIAGSLYPEVREAIVAAAADPAFAGAGAPFYVRCLWGTAELAQAGTPLVNDDMVEAIGKLPGVDPWLLEVVPGLHLARKVRFAQGSEAQRMADLQAATRHLVAAYKLRPEFPPAAVGMIILTALSPGAGGGSARDWFERAVDAQLDYQPAYVAYINSLRPGNGGSIPAMYHFAVECLESRRFDTEVPLWYARTLQAIGEEVRESRTVWAHADVARRLDVMFDGYLALMRDGGDPQSLHAGRCMTAWAGGRYDAALAAWEAAGKSLHASWLPVIAVDDPELVEFDLAFLDKRKNK